MELTIATHIPWHVWADEDAVVVATAFAVLEDLHREQVRAAARVSRGRV